jgi:hypothetical protein
MTTTLTKSVDKLGKLIQEQYECLDTDALDCQVLSSESSVPSSESSGEEEEDKKVFTRKCHACVLSGHSSVLRLQIQENKTIILEASETTIKSVLRFMYYGELVSERLFLLLEDNDDDEKKKKSLSSTLPTLHELARFAELYMMEPMKQAIEEAAVLHMIAAAKDDKHILNLCYFGSSTPRSCLGRAMLTFLSMHLSTVPPSDLLWLSDELFHSLLERDDVRVSEDTLYDLVAQWIVKDRVRLDHGRDDNKSKMFPEHVKLMRKIRFPTMSAAALAKASSFLCESSTLSHHELSDIWTCMALSDDNNSTIGVDSEKQENLIKLQVSLKEVGISCKPRTGLFVDSNFYGKLCRISTLPGMFMRATAAPSVPGGYDTAALNLTSDEFKQNFRLHPALNQSKQATIPPPTVRCSIESIQFPGMWVKNHLGSLQLHRMTDTAEFRLQASFEWQLCGATCPGTKWFVEVGDSWKINVQCRIDAVL